MIKESSKISFFLEHVPFIDIGMSLFELYKENQKEKFRQKLTHFITINHNEPNLKIFDVLLVGFTKEYQETNIGRNERTLKAT